MARDLPEPDQVGCPRVIDVGPGQGFDADPQPEWPLVAGAKKDLRRNVVATIAAIALTDCRLVIRFVRLGMLMAVG